MISTSNYVARKFGVRIEMLTLKLCQSLKIVPDDYHKYSAEAKNYGNTLILRFK